MKKLSTFLISVIVLFFLGLLFCCFVQADDSTVAKTDRFNFFRDDQFKRGFYVVNEGKSEGILPFSTFQKTLPWWTLAEHASQYDITKVPLTFQDKTMVEYRDPGKMVQIQRTEQGENILRLNVYGEQEYKQPRKKASDPWVHLLLSKNFAPQEQAELNGPEALCFSCDLRVAQCENRMKPDDYDSRLHCGQTTIYFIFQNLNKKSADYGDYLWFGIYVYDSRYILPEERIMIDGSTKVAEGEKRGTGKLIYVPGGEKALNEFYHGNNPADFKWVHVEANLSRYVQEALSTAQQKGFLTHTSLPELKIGHFNFGWEVTGTFDCSLEIKNLNLFYDNKTMK